MPAGRTVLTGTTAAAGRARGDDRVGRRAARGRRERRGRRRPGPPRGPARRGALRRRAHRGRPDHRGHLVRRRARRHGDARRRRGAAPRASSTATCTSTSRGAPQWEGFASATRAAAAGGVTTIVDMPLNSIPPTISVEALHVKRAAAKGQVAVDVAFWGGAVPGNVDQLRADARRRRRRVQVLPARLRRPGVPAPRRRRAAGRPDRARDLRRPADRARRGRRRARDGPAAVAARATRAFLASRPGRAEESAIGRVVAAARDTGARVHVVHLADADAVPMLRRARAEGVRITVETCPHYLTFAAEGVPDGATSFKCCPPIREALAPRGALGGARRRRRRPGGERPLTVHARPQAARRPATSGRPGAGSPRCRWRCPRSGPAPGHAGSGWSRWCAGWPRRRRGWPGCRPRGPSPWAGTPTWWPSPPTSAGRSARCSTATRSRRTRGGSSSAPSAGPGCAGGRPTAPRSDGCSTGEPRRLTGYFSCACSAAAS